MSKVYNAMPGEDLDRNRRGNSRVWIARAVEDSLRRLATDYLDVYLVHRPTRPSTSTRRSGAQRPGSAGKDPRHRHVKPPGRADRRGAVDRAATTPRTVRRRTTPLLDTRRHAEAATLPTALRFGMGVTVWSPLDGGWLTGKYRAGAAPMGDSQAMANADHFDFAGEQIRERKLDLVESLVLLARAEGCSLIELALRFVLAHPGVTSAIMGPRTLSR